MRFQNVGVYENLISGSRCFDGSNLKDRSTLFGALLRYENSEDELMLRNQYKYSSNDILYFLRVSDHWFYLKFLKILYTVFPPFTAPVIFVLIFKIISPAQHLF